MRKEYTYDRAEDGIAVCHDREDGTQTELPAELLSAAGVPEGGIFAADIEENEILNIEYLARQTEEVKSRAKSRLSALFGRIKGEKR